MEIVKLETGASGETRRPVVTSSVAIRSQNLSLLRLVTEGKIKPFLNTTDEFFALLQERYEGALPHFYEDVYRGLVESGQPWAFEIEYPDGSRLEGSVHAGTMMVGDLESIDTLAIIVDL